MNATISNVVVFCDTVECGYRIVELEDGRFAFVWGNVKARVGDTLAAELFSNATDEKGAEAFDNYSAAELAFRKCAEALEQVGSPAAAEMLAAV